MVPARRSSKKTGATGTPPLSTPGSQPGRQSTIKFAKINTRPLSTPEPQLERCLLNLPAEVRLLIYKQMFPRDKFDVYAIKGSLHKAADVHHIAGDHVAILTTCRTIYIEAKPVLYSNTEFCIHVRNQYWLHLWSTEIYEETFEVEDFLDEPQSGEWNGYNPWLQEPRSIVPIDNVRTLTLAIECSAGASSHDWTWTGQLRHTLRGASNIQKLHIRIKDPYEDHQFQATTDLMMGILGQCIRCRGVVTAELDLALGSENFDSRSYYKMLDGFKGWVILEHNLLTVG
jgi:hypothetical protein